jgi:hypothetical protein
VGVDSQFFEEDGQFIYQRNIQVPLGVLDDFCGFSDLDAAGAMRACANDGFYKASILSVAASVEPEVTFITLVSV